MLSSSLALEFCDHKTGEMEQNFNKGAPIGIIVTEVKEEIPSEDEGNIEGSLSEENALAADVPNKVESGLGEEEEDFEIPEPDIKNETLDHEEMVPTSVIVDGHECSYCGKKYRFPSALKRHIVSHTSEKNFECQICQRRFGSNNHCLRHYRSVHKLDPPLKPIRSKLRCDVCGEECASMGKLKRHVIFRHTKEKPFPCPLCSGKSFYSNSHLQRHLRSHLQEKPFACSFCDRRFMEKFNLATHERIHADEIEYPFSCSFCQKKFRASNTLRQHQMIHTGEKRHVCGVTECGKKFIAKSTMQRHMMTHTKEKPFQCWDCGKRFGTRSHVRRHYSGVHGGQEPKCVKVISNAEEDTSQKIMYTQQEAINLS